MPTLPFKYMGKLILKPMSIWHSRVSALAEQGADLMFIPNSTAFKYSYQIIDEMTPAKNDQGIDR